MTPRVGFLNYALDRAPGGIGRYTSELTRALSQEGVSVTVLWAGRARASGVVGMPGAGLLPGLLTLGQAQIALAARHHRLDLVHDPTGSMPLLLTGVRRVATVHDVIPYVHPETSSTLDLLIYRLWLPLIAPRLDAIITGSEYSRTDIIRYLGIAAEKVTVIPAAVGPEYRPLPEEEIQPTLARLRIGRPYILFVGSIEPRKNLVRLLEAFSRLRKWSKQWTLVIVGARKWKHSPVFEMVRRLELEPYVRFTGFVPDDDLPVLYSGASLVVYPSLYEGFGLPVLEAMACGAPVVASSTSSLPEVAGDAALLVDPFDVAALAEAMREVLSNQDLAARLCARGLARAQEFSWRRTAREVAILYDRVLNGKEITGC